MLGSARLYNPSEEAHEKLNQDHTYTYVTDDAPIPKNLFLPDAREESVGVYFSSNQDDINAAIKTVSPDRAAKIIVRVAKAQEQVSPPVIPQNTSTTPPVKEVFETPVELRVKPEKYTAPSGYHATILAVVGGLYFRDTLWGFPVIIDGDRVSPRGQMSNESVTLSPKMPLSEMAKVLVHELGHMIDIYALKQKNFTPDPSKSFYAISWTEPTVIKSGLTSTSFVSGYAATNQYEDFAESFAMYVFHNQTFKQRALKNNELQQKYNFLQNSIFRGFFEGTTYEKDPIPTKLWDVTKIVIKANALTDIFTAMREIILRVL